MQYTELAIYMPWNDIHVIIVPEAPVCVLIGPEAPVYVSFFVLLNKLLILSRVIARNLLPNGA